ncbi:hypothetical protein OKW23_000709 [Bacilli bacterium PM5-9]|nr:hypothetical protein [Bacilli bacterium PM5-9]
MKKLNIKKIREILQYGTLTCKQISEITGQTIHAAKQMRLDIIEEYKDRYRYTAGASIRTDHFIIWYNNPVINKEYELLYELGSDKKIANSQSFIFKDSVDLINLFDYNKLLNNNKLSLS